MISTIVIMELPLQVNKQRDVLAQVGEICVKRSVAKL
jgi:hypothetical protein